ncbi:MAG: roadblock/LC7 domain-containing protein [Candidatus Lokiarchaeota archaeon]|nr:roadblock/LC7 domain-containing protein [Candidatus Lokiarchaeota archaeon]
MNSDLAEYLEYLCSEIEDINSLIVVSNEGLPIALASSIQTSDQTLISGMCTAIKCIGRELIRETTDSTLKRMLVDCTEGVILIQPLNQGILVASCKNAEALSKLDVASIQTYFSTRQNHLVAL